MAYYVVALLALLRALLLQVRPQRERWWRAAPGNAAYYATILVAIFAAKYAAIVYAARNVSPRFGWESTLPFPVTHDNLPHITHDGAVTFAYAAMTVVSTVCLAGLAATWQATSRSKRIVVALATAMCAAAVAMPVLTSGDLYSNIGYTLLGPHAYSPPAIAFGGAFGAIDRWWGVPLVPSPYGPLWLASTGAATAAFSTLVAKAYAIRCVAALAVAGAIACVARLERSWTLCALVALDPDVWLQFVANAHADALALLCAAFAAVAALHGRRAVTAMAIIAAGLVKLPYVLSGLAILVAFPRRRERIACGAVAVVAAVGISFAAGGPEYVRALGTHVSQRSGMLLTPDHLVAAACAAIAIAVAIGKGRRIAEAAWLMPALAPASFPWYLGLGFPYAAGSPEALRRYLVFLPCAMLLMDGTFGRPWLSAAAIAAMASLVAVNVFRPSLTAK